MAIGCFEEHFASFGEYFNALVEIGEVGGFVVCTVEEFRERSRFFLGGGDFAIEGLAGVDRFVSLGDGGEWY